MARRRRTPLTLSAEQARQALAVLIQDGKVAISEVQRALKRREHLIRELRSRLASLGEDGVWAGRRLRKSAAAGFRAAERASRPIRKRAKPRISTATRKIYQAQGRYMAALRQLSKGARKQIKAIREKSGVKAAITAAKRMAK
jgi:hypothetical protein